MLPTEDDAVRFIGRARWGRRPRCPYCMSFAATAVRNGVRYFCNHCRTSFSPTVGTVFHGTHLDIRTWLLIITNAFGGGPAPTSRSLAREFNINKNTASRLLRSIRAMDAESQVLVARIENFLLRATSHQEKELEDEQ